MGSNEERDRELRARLAEIRRSYVDTLRVHGAELVALLAQSTAGHQGAREQILALVHKLAGTAGSFGIVEIAQPASEIELALMEPDEPPDTDARLRDLVERLANIKAD